MMNHIDYLGFHCACACGDVEKVDAFLNAGAQPSGYALVLAAQRGKIAVVKRLMQDARIDPSYNENEAVRAAVRFCERATFDIFANDSRVDVTAVLDASPVFCRQIFECRERFTEICIALQGLDLPAWVTVKILKACKPWSTLKLHQKWNLACAVKHFHDKE